MLRWGLPLNLSSSGLSYDEKKKDIGADDELLSSEDGVSLCLSFFGVMRVAIGERSYQQ